MEGWILVVLLIIAAPLALAVWLIVRASDARNRIEELSRRIDFLEIELAKAKEGEPTLVQKLARKPHPREPEPGPTPEPTYIPQPSPAPPAAPVITPHRPPTAAPV